MERPLFWRIFIWFLLSIKNKAILIANEATDLKLKSINMEVICKIDFKKGVRSHQLRILNYGFGQKQITWIKWCISTTYFSVLFNGNPFGFFQSPKGLREGKSYFPLFILTMKALNQILSRAREGSSISGFKVGQMGGEWMKVPYLLFVFLSMIPYFFVTPIKGNWNIWVGL